MSEEEIKESSGQMVIYSGMPNLTQKPACKEVTCGVRSLKSPTSVLSTIPYTSRLQIRRKGIIDEIKGRVPNPRGCVPPTALLSWYELPMESKIPSPPLLEKELSITRGKIGTQLNRRHPFFTLCDSRNQERVTGTAYSALHDPYAKNYIMKPSVKKLLKKQGLINEYDEVLCSLKDFNEYRRYLSAQYHDKVSDILKTQDKLSKVENDQLKRIKDHERLMEPQINYEQCLAFILEQTKSMRQIRPVSAKR